jgi:hypothetical protein
MPGRRSLQLPAAPPQPRHTSGRLSNGVRETESGSEQILLDVDREVSVRCVIKFVALGDRKGQTEEIVLGEPAEKDSDLGSFLGTSQFDALGMERFAHSRLLPVIAEAAMSLPGLCQRALNDVPPLPPATAIRMAAS